jgi:hypothetical protein
VNTTEGEPKKQEEEADRWEQEPKQKLPGYTIDKQSEGAKGKVTVVISNHRRKAEDLW